MTSARQLLRKTLCFAFAVLPGQVYIWAADGRAPSLDVTYVTNEGFLVQAAGKKVLIDSLFDTGFNAFLIPSPQLLEQLTAAQGPFADVDLVLVTHPHGDHFNAKLVAAHLRNNPRCRLVAHTQTVDQLRKEGNYSRIRDRIHEVNGELGSRERITLEGIDVDVLCVAHGAYYKDGRNVHSQIRNLAFVVNLGGTRFLHVGDATLEDNAAHFNAFPFDQTPIDLLFLGSDDRSQATQRLIADRIKPGRIVAMHIPPAEVEEQSAKIQAVYPEAIVFAKSMERRLVPSKADFSAVSRAFPPRGAASR